jgi:hypothetical protein
VTRRRSRCVPLTILAMEGPVVVSGSSPDNLTEQFARRVRASENDRLEDCRGARNSPSHPGGNVLPGGGGGTA